MPRFFRMIYSRIQFPPYEYREFPKWIAPAEGAAPVLVHSAEEEAALVAPAEAKRPVPRKKVAE